MALSMLGIQDRSSLLGGPDLIGLIGHGFLLGPLYMQPFHLIMTVFSGRAVFYHMVPGPAGYMVLLRPFVLLSVD